jgi:peptidoglycan hydrolase-like protein with peptidoglycan-binding domain
MFLLLGSTALQAQNRLVVPRGSVIIVRTQNVLESSTARPGQTFETIVVDSLGVDNYTVIPAGSRIRGVVVVAQPATRQQSGVIEVNFDRLTLPDGTFFPLDGRLTSTDSAERRQIEARTDQRVVLVGGRGGIGAAIAGAGASGGTTSSILSALGSLLSEGEDVRVPIGTPLAVQLEQRLVLRGRGLAQRPNASTIYTDAERIREAQRALARLNYYRGAADGELTYATQRALFEYQIDRGLSATGNLDGRTAQALGLSLDITGSGAAALSATEASTVRRNAQTVVSRARQDLAISAVGRLDPRMAYAEGDLDLWFALSAFADNASLYEQVVRAAANPDGALLAGRALISSAQRVDAAMARTRPSTLLRNQWASIRQQLVQVDPAYR